MSKEDKVENITHIEKLVGKSYHTLLRWVRDLNFPMYKEGGQWVLIRKEYEDWRDCQKENKMYEKKKTAGKSGKK